MRDLRSNRLAIARRRGWVIVLTTIIVAGSAYLYAQRAAPTYVASAYVVVNSGASRTGPGSANEASSLATTYAGLIPKDNLIIQSVSAQLAQKPSTVVHSISVFTSNSTAILQLRYTASTRGMAIAGAKAVALAITGPDPASNTVPAGAVLLASLPSSASASSSTRSTALPLGVLGGVLLGLVIMIAWEHYDPRVDDLKDLAEVLGAPVTAGSEIGPDRARALRRRWSLLVGSAREEKSPVDMGRDSGHVPDAPVTVALVSVSDRWQELSDSVCRSLDESFDQGPSTQMADGQPSPHLQITAFGSPRSLDGARLASMPVDFTVVVARAGGRAEEIREAIAILDSYGLAAGWGILSRPPRSYLRGSLRWVRHLAAGSQAGGSTVTSGLDYAGPLDGPGSAAEDDMDPELPAAAEDDMDPELPAAPEPSAEEVSGEPPARRSAQQKSS